jgi:hypothetical protein
MKTCEKAAKSPSLTNLPYLYATGPVGSWMQLGRLDLGTSFGTSLTRPRIGIMASQGGVALPGWRYDGSSAHYTTVNGRLELGTFGTWWLTRHRIIGMASHGGIASPGSGMMAACALASTHGGIEERQPGENEMHVMGSSAGALPPRHDDNLDRWFLQLPIQPLRTPPSLEPQQTIAELGQGGREGELSNSTHRRAREQHAYTET